MVKDLAQQSGSSSHIEYLNDTQLSAPKPRTFLMVSELAKSMRLSQHNPAIIPIFLLGFVRHSPWQRFRLDRLGSTVADLGGRNA
jgi:hypothetical protein